MADGFWSNLFNGIGNNLGGIGQAAGLAGAGLLFNKAYENMGDVGQTALEKSNALAQQALGQTQFRPFTVTTGLGSLQATPQGGYGMTLSPQQQALQNQLFGGAQGFYGQAMTPTLPAQQALQNQLFNTAAQQFGVAGQALSPEQAALQKQLTSGASSMYAQALKPQQQRTQEVYNQLRAMQTPEEQRQRLALEERLAGQGRLGVRTAQYGGTPEQFALAKAQEEAQNQASFAAMEQAMREQAQAAGLAGQFQEAGYRPMAELQRQQGTAAELGALLQQAGYTPFEKRMQEQAQAAELGRLFQGGGYLPLSSLLSAYQPGLQGAQLASQMQQSGAGLFGEATMGGINALLASRLGQGTLAGNIGSALAQGSLGGMLSQMENGGNTSLGNLFGDIFKGIQGLF